MGNQQRLASDDEVKHFDDLSADYKKIHDRALFLAGGDSDHFYLQKIKMIRENIAREPASILDFGCGTGRLSVLLARSFPRAEITGFDPSTESLREAEKLRRGHMSFTADPQELENGRRILISRWQPASSTIFP